MIIIETAIESLALPETREVFDFLATRLEVEAGEANFQDLKGLLLDIPDVEGDQDIARLCEMPRELKLL